MIKSYDLKQRKTGKVFHADSIFSIWKVSTADIILFAKT